ncbi:competence protein ComK [Bacillus dakarensis]|uniref:competence protein ComK n=1 Tax=Robertmurraya dakarensis TaxID=1926278 RepID=UPI0009816CA4|nr:competence protein ComK [Bacillus dakarensis]
MEWKQIETFLSSGQAFVPVYQENVGDSVQVLFKDGSSELLEMRCESFLNKLLYYFGTSLAANRDRFGKLVGKKQLVPVVLSYGTILIPFHVRKPIGHQTPVGWVIAKEVQGFDPETKNETTVYLSKHEMKALHTEKFCKEQLKNARYLELCYGEIHEPYRKSWVFSAG